MKVESNPVFKNVYWDFKPNEGEEIVIGKDGISYNSEEKLAAGEKIELVVNDFDRNKLTVCMRIPACIPIYSGNSFFYDFSPNSNFKFKISVLPEDYNLFWYSDMIRQTGTSYWVEPKEIILGDKLSIYFHSIHSGKARLKFVAPKDIKFQSLKSDQT